MNRMLPLYVTLSTFVQDKASNIQRRYADNDKGAPLVEYAALLFVIGLIAVALHGAHIDQKVKQAVTDAISKIFSGN